jgi:hypothetical protein
MKSTTKAIFSLGLISFLTLGGLSQNAFAVETKAVGQSATTTSKPAIKTHTVKKPAIKTHAVKKPTIKTHTVKTHAVKK